MSPTKAPAGSTAPAFTYPKPSGAAAGSSIDTHATRPDVTLAWITPAVADVWLAKNTHNRPLRNSQVDFLKGVMERGEWMLNGDTIRWSPEGVLQDGQHRLWAVSITGISIPSYVAVGIAAPAQETMDTGARRSLTDALRLRGFKNSSSLAAAITYFWRVENDAIRYATTRPSIHQALALFDEHPDIGRAVGDVAHQFTPRFKASHAMVSAALYVLRTIDEEDADEFFARLCKGDQLTEKDPIFLLRKHFELAASSLGGVRAKSAILIDHALINKAWNYWRDGRKIDRLLWKAAGTKAEQFPEPH